MHLFSVKNTFDIMMMNLFWNNVRCLSSSVYNTTDSKFYWSDTNEAVNPSLYCPVAIKREGGRSVMSRETPPSNNNLVIGDACITSVPQGPTDLNCFMCFSPVTSCAIIG